MLQPAGEGDVQHLRRATHVGVAPLAQELAAAAKSGGAENEGGYRQTRTPEGTKLHVCLRASGRDRRPNVTSRETYRIPGPRTAARRA
ncbi:MAG: hypothetical protein ABW003_15720 [Microvirga sp.]